MVDFYETVADYIKRNKINEYRFEKMCGLSRGIVRKWRLGLVSPTLATLQKISDGTGIPLERWVK